MCLIIGNNIELVAKKDIIVYKELNLRGDKFYTPYMGKCVELNNMLTPDNYNIDCHARFTKYCIDSGAIHAYIKKDNTCFMALIRKGTTYYVQDDFTEIAAKELYITSEQVSGRLISPDMDAIYRDYIDAVMNNPEYRGNNGVSVGYYRLSDGTYVNPLSDFDKTKAIGIVAFIDQQGNPVTMALESRRLPWLTDYPLEYQISSNIGISKTVNDVKGYKHTHDICNNKKYDPDKFKAVEYCCAYNTYSTYEGDWYLGAVGEMTKISQNMGILNAVMCYTNIGEPLEDKPYWTSSETMYYGRLFVWAFHMFDGFCSNFRAANKGIKVRPLSCFC